MDRDALLQLSREDLAALVLVLRAEVAALKAEVARRGGPPKTPENSSVPPSQGFKPNRTERQRAKRGGRRGHAGISRRRQRPDVVVRCRPERCDGCGAALPVAGQRRVGRSQVVEVPPLRPVVIEAWRYAARCRGCGVRTAAPAPAGLALARVFGPEVEVLLAYLHEAHHLGYERPVGVCRDAISSIGTASTSSSTFRRRAD